MSLIDRPVPPTSALACMDVLLAILVGRSDDRRVPGPGLPSTPLAQVATVEDDLGGDDEGGGEGAEDEAAFDRGDGRFGVDDGLAGLEGQVVADVAGQDGAE